MNIQLNDTIASIATPPGEGAIAVVRMSGPKSIEIADRAFIGKVRLAQVPSHSIKHGFIQRKDGQVIDEVLASVFKLPNSFTGEDIVEISCHGGMLVSAKILEVLLQAGARQAEPGEFSRRAFLNGKIDLSKAEAIAGIIAARSSAALRSCVDQLEGLLARRVGELRGELLNLASSLELELDFSEEGIELVSREAVQRRISSVRNSMSSLINSYESGRIVREGASVIILGKPNAGKSSLFNRLVQSERAIISPHPGTTRDYIEEAISLDGLLFKITDTAGIRESTDQIEFEGVSRAKARSVKSDISILVTDATESTESPPLVLPSLNIEKLITVYNKIDLLSPEGRIKLSESVCAKRNSVMLSALTGEGVDDLKSKLTRLILDSGRLTEESVQITSMRHKECLERADSELARAEQSFIDSEPNEIIAFELRQCICEVSEITGEVTTEAILDNIFTKFCIGK